MTYTHNLLLYHTITPLHVGCGRDVGVVDLPVIRERTTGYPFIPGSGIRGALRDHVETSAKGGETTAEELFGPKPKAGEEVAHAGCVSIHDARLLLFPVRSDHKVFLWLTCPTVLRRFRRDVKLFDSARSELTAAVAVELGDEHFLGPKELVGGTTVHLEELAYEAVENGTGDKRGSLTRWAAKLGNALGLKDLAGRTFLVSDASFVHFVTFATVIQQHNRLSSAKTVEPGALFSVEAVPPEAIFYGFAGATQSRKKPQEGKKRSSASTLLSRLQTRVTSKVGNRHEGHFHFGGDESTGLGVTRLVWPGVGRRP